MMSCYLAYFLGIATVLVPVFLFVVWAIRTAEDAPFLPDNWRELR